jgi:hypothetical protein
MGTYVLNSLERSLKRTHVHGSHTLFLQVILVLPLVTGADTSREQDLLDQPW